MNKEPAKYFYMTVYVRTINGKTISIKCDKRDKVLSQSKMKSKGRQRSRKPFSTSRIKGKL